MPRKSYPAPSERLTDLARTPRQDAPVPERQLWGTLRNRQLDGLKFRRQRPVDPSIVDFFCYEAWLVEELDGLSHVGRAARDDRRTRDLEGKGWDVIRITNDDVLEGFEAVTDYISREARK